LRITSIPSEESPTPLAPAVIVEALITFKSPEVFKIPVSKPEIVVPERVTDAPYALSSLNPTEPA